MRKKFIMQLRALETYLNVDHIYLFVIKGRIRHPAAVKEEVGYQP